MPNLFAILTFLFIIECMENFAFSALKLLVGSQQEHVKNLECLYSGGGDLTGVLHVLKKKEFHFAPAAH